MGSRCNWSITYAKTLTATIVITIATLLSCINSPYQQVRGMGSRCTWTLATAMTVTASFVISLAIWFATIVAAAKTLKANLSVTFVRIITIAVALTVECRRTLLHRLRTFLSTNLFRTLARSLMDALVAIAKTITDKHTTTVAPMFVFLVIAAKTLTANIAHKVASKFATLATNVRIIITLAVALTVRCWYTTLHWLRKIFSLNFFRTLARSFFDASAIAKTITNARILITPAVAHTVGCFYATLLWLRKILSPIFVRTLARSLFDAPWTTAAQQDVHTDSGTTPATATPGTRKKKRRAVPKTAPLTLTVPTAGSLPAPQAQVFELQQLDDSDFVQQVDEWFDEITFSLSDRSMMRETLPLLRDKAEASQNLALKRACELHLS